MVNKQKLVVVVMGQDCERFIGMALESVKDSDVIVYCDGESTDFTMQYVIENSKALVIQNKYDKKDPTMNGKQRNFYLDYIKKNFPDYWCLVIDADEVVADLEVIKDFIQKGKKGLYPVHMRHFIGNLGQEDATVETHWALNRLFKISEAKDYPEVEHPVLEGVVAGLYDETTIWHLGYISGIFDIKNKYENHSAKSNMHTPEFLRDWYYKHLFGHYPVKKVNLFEIPAIILKNFGINPDEIYFNTHSTLELRHFLMMKNWVDYFKPENIVDLGAGMGLYGYVAKYLGIDYLGVEQSEFAVERAVAGMVQGDIRDFKLLDKKDLVLVIDVLEHIREKELDKTLKNISKYGNKYLFSVPYVGDPNLHLDPTHRIFRPKKWWLKQLRKYFKITDVPLEWHFNNQLLMGVPND